MSNYTRWFGAVSTHVVAVIVYTRYYVARLIVAATLESCHKVGEYVVERQIIMTTIHKLQ